MEYIWRESSYGNGKLAALDCVQWKSYVWPKACLIVIGCKSMWWARCMHICNQFVVEDLVNLIWLWDVSMNWMYRLEMNGNLKNIEEICKWENSVCWSENLDKCFGNNDRVREYMSWKYDDERCVCVVKWVRRTCVVWLQSLYGCEKKWKENMDAEHTDIYSDVVISPHTFKLIIWLR